LNSATGNSYSEQQIIEKEGEILRTMKWDLLKYSIIDFVNLFLSQGCIFSHDELSVIKKENMGRNSVTKVSQQNAEYLRKYAEFFTDFCLQDENFIYSNYCLLACAILAFSRKHIRLNNLWPIELELMSGTTS
jgi:Cyclin, C-terminal domain